MAVFSGGQLKPATDKDATNRRRKWALPGSAQGGAVYIGDKSVSILLLCYLALINLPSPATPGLLVVIQ